MRQCVRDRSACLRPVELFTHSDMRGDDHESALCFQRGIGIHQIGWWDDSGKGLTIHRESMPRVSLAGGGISSFAARS